ncbi:Arv1-domain-containing protein [Wolfiporia cocos MD-104 SS10]|uniref:Protein ARV n=1 Tax=Wolfiporia cocos (strain MD-104) TaxID=742152 RepID=A0A2H3K1T3_WOLCO|nr:Arv1-domain-containing protein [Wolfiporia cocos MD-104 SS10]
MPICTNCTHPTPYLYTVYQSAYNLRLEQCPECRAFADPYVEHDTLTLLLDLILLKRDVYRHLLYNRGLGARKVEHAAMPAASDALLGENVQHGDTGPEFPTPKEQIGDAERNRNTARWWLIVRLGTILIMTDAFIRWTHLSSGASYHASDGDPTSWTLASAEGFLRVFVGCLLETVAFHAGIILACYSVLACLDWARSLSPASSAVSKPSGIRQEFRYSHVPLTLLYSSLTKLFLLFLLSIWRPTSTHRAPPGTSFTHPFILNALSVLDEHHLDREWVVRNVLGGMAVGFGLRVVLDCHPFFTTTIILGGWFVKTLAANLISQWVSLGSGLEGSGVIAGETWLAYSIP